MDIVGAPTTIVHEVFLLLVVPLVTSFVTTIITTRLKMIDTALNMVHYPVILLGHDVSLDDFVTEYAGLCEKKRVTFASRWGTVRLQCLKQPVIVKTRLKRSSFLSVEWIIVQRMPKPSSPHFEKCVLLTNHSLVERIIDGDDLSGGSHEIE